MSEIDEQIYLNALIDVAATHAALDQIVETLAATSPDRREFIAQFLQGATDRINARCFAPIDEAKWPALRKQISDRFCYMLRIFPTGNGSTH